MSRSPMRPQQAQPLQLHQSSHHPWHEATKRQIMGAAWNDTVKSGSGSKMMTMNYCGTGGNHDNNEESLLDGTNKEHVTLLVEDLTATFEQMVAHLKAEMMDAKLQQEEALNIGLVKLPKAIRQMSIQDFNQAHQCDLLALFQKAKASKDKGVLGRERGPPHHQRPLLQPPQQSQSSILSSDAVAGGHKKRDFQMSVAETPAPRSRTIHDAAPMSELRTIRKGEGLYSANGSPVETHEVGTVVATVTKKRRGNVDTDAANFEINVGDGRFINLNDPTGVSELDSNMKATAASQLKVLQDQMASLMAQLTK